MSTSAQPKLQEIAVFDNLTTAQNAKQTLSQSDLDLNGVEINGDINSYEKLAAVGTVVGGEAGLLVGLFYGGTLGVIAVLVVATLITGEVQNSALHYAVIAAFALAGALFGYILSQRIRADHLPVGATKGNPDVPRRFKLFVEGSPEEISKAKDMLGYANS